MNANPVVDTRQQILDTARAIIVSKGFAAVGLSEILAAAGVPKGSFYHWFRSKDQFGEALLERHFEGYLEQTDALLAAPGQNAAARLLAFFGRWHALQSGDDLTERCLVVKLSAEVCDLSESMRATLEHGTTQVLARLEGCLRQGISDGELTRCPRPGRGGGTALPAVAGRHLAGPRAAQLRAARPSAGTDTSLVSASGRAGLIANTLTARSA